MTSYSTYLLLLGVDQSTPLEKREKLYCSDSQVIDIYQKIRTISRFPYKVLKEVVILKTCHRVEIYGVASDLLQGYEALSQLLLGEEKKQQDLFDVLYRKNTMGVVEHLYTVASGLDSMVIGENEILGQVKRAYEQAHRHGSTSVLLNRLFQSAVEVGKRVRTETRINRGKVSIGSLCIDLVEKLHASKSHYTVCVIGTGDIAKNVLHHLKKRTHASIVLIGRCPQKTKQLAAMFGATTRPFEDRHKALLCSDVCLTSTSSETYLIHKNEMEQLYKTDLKAYRSKKILLVDLSVPRNMDPSVKEWEHVILYTMDDLQMLIQNHKELRMQSVQACRSILLAAIEEFTLWLAKQELLPSIRVFGEQLEDMKQETLSFFSRQMTNLPEDHKQLIDKIINKFIAKLTKRPLKQVERISHQHRELYSDFFKHSFKS